MPLFDRLKLGRKGEAEAAKYLKRKGYRIVERNLRTPIGEIDIVAERGGLLVFVEVKTRRSNQFGEPTEAVDSRKQEKLRRLALYYMKCKGVELPVRFDVIGVWMDGQKRIEHIEGAF